MSGRPIGRNHHQTPSGSSHFRSLSPSPGLLLGPLLHGLPQNSIPSVLDEVTGEPGYPTDSSSRALVLSRDTSGFVSTPFSPTHRDRPASDATGLQTKHRAIAVIAHRQTTPVSGRRDKLSAKRAKSLRIPHGTELMIGPFLLPFDPRSASTLLPFTSPFYPNETEGAHFRCSIQHPDQKSLNRTPHRRRVRANSSQPASRPFHGTAFPGQFAHSRDNSYPGSPHRTRLRD